MFIACCMLHALHCTALRMLHCMPHQLCARTLGGGVARCCRKLSDALVQRIRLATRLRWCKQQMPYNTHRATCNAHRAKYNTHRATCNRTTYSTHRAACNSHRATYNRATLQRALCNVQHTPCSKQSCNTTHIMQRATQDMPQPFLYRTLHAVAQALSLESTLLRFSCTRSTAALWLRLQVLWGTLPASVHAGAHSSASRPYSGMNTNAQPVIRHCGWISRATASHRGGTAGLGT